MARHGTASGRSKRSARRGWFTACNATARRRLAREAAISLPSARVWATPALVELHREFGPTPSTDDSRPTCALRPQNYGTLTRVLDRSLRRAQLHAERGAGAGTPTLYRRRAPNRSAHGLQSASRIPRVQRFISKVRRGGIDAEAATEIDSPVHQCSRMLLRQRPCRYLQP